MDALRTELDQALEERQLDRVADLLDKMKSLAATLDELANNLDVLISNTLILRKPVSPVLFLW